MLDYVARGETDAGIVYANDARVAGEKIRLVAAAENTHVQILYPIAIIKGSKQKQSSQEFLDLVLSGSVSVVESIRTEPLSLITVSFIFG